MSRLTEYHCGTAVIKDKSKLQEAMHKLAIIDDFEELQDSSIEEELKELRVHRNSFLKKSPSWRVVNRAINLIIGLNAELALLRQKEGVDNE